MQSITPGCSHPGLGSYDFARRYFRNRCFFLFLRLLRCFSSAGSLRMTMDSSYGTWCLTMWVSPFGYLRIYGYLLLPAAFRSLSRPSSAPSARASALRPFCLTAPHTHSVACAGFFRNFRFSLVLYLFGYLSVSSMSLPIRQLSLTHSFFGMQFSRYELANFLANGDKGIRTLDPLLARQVLSQLSYTPTYGIIIQLSSLVFSDQWA